MRAGKAFVVIATFAVSALGLARPARADSVRDIYDLLEGGRVDEARPKIAELADKNPDSNEVRFLDGALRFYTGEYEQATQILSALAKDVSGRDTLHNELGMLVDLSASTANVVKGFLETKSPSGHFVLRYAKGRDELLVPYALEALDRAYEALREDFGDAPKEPVRVEIYGAVSDLARVSTLTEREIEASGTIALCKFNRLMITSPRALATGYPWLDTLTHEYTHYVVTRISHDHVPIWLHEGIAKFEERRWRRASGGGLSPTMEHLLATGLDKNKLITFEQMHPSMAKLPTQEDTALAFAEVYTAIEYLHERAGWPGIRRAIDLLRDGASDAEAIAKITKTSFAGFQKDWKKWMHARGYQKRPGLIPTKLKFKRGKDDKNDKEDDDSGAISEDKARGFARLGGLMRARKRLSAAAMEYEKAAALVGPAHPSVANKLARTYLELGDHDRAIRAAEPCLSLYPESAAPSAILGAAYAKKGDLAHAGPALETAISISPFDPVPHCELETVYRKQNDPRADREKQVCQALTGR